MHAGLDELRRRVTEGELVAQPADEDVHGALEAALLTIVGADLGGDRADAVVARRSAAGLHPETAGGQVDLVVEDHDVGRAEIMLAHDGADRLAIGAPDDRRDQALVERHGIAWHEKKLGQLFCDQSSKQILQLLEDECADAGVDVRVDCKVASVGRDALPRVRATTKSCASDFPPGKRPAKWGQCC